MIMKISLSLVLVFFIFQFSAHAQPVGDVFPDFTVTDIEGNVHTLQDYLDDGKTVMIEVFATWCGTCLNTLPAVESVYESFGPDGDNSLVLFSFENDANTSDEAAYAALHGITNPVIANGLVQIESWNTFFQPNFFVVCSDGSFDHYFSGVFGSNSILVDMVEACNTSATGIFENEPILNLTLFSNPVEDRLEFEVNTDLFIEFNIIDISGKTLIEGRSEFNKNSIDVSNLESGIYFLQVEGGRKSGVTKKFIKR